MTKKTLDVIPKQELLFLPLGGSGEIGMNLNLYGYQNQWLMVDLGVTFDHHLGIEILMPDTQFIEAHKKNLAGLVVTHAHEDHIGAIPYLWRRLKCPLYATPFTAHLIREKLKETGIHDAPLHVIPLKGDFKVGPFSLEYITLTHSIPEPNALVIRTPAGNVVHTGDWKIDDHPYIGEKTDDTTLKALGDEGVLALVCDSTNVFVEGMTGSEKDVRDALRKVIQEQENRVVVSCFASNVARLKGLLDVAHEVGRQVALSGRSLHRMFEAAKSCGYLGDYSLLDEDAWMKLSPEKALLICTGSQGEPRAALARIAQNRHPKIRLDKEDTVIFSSRQIPGNEDQILALQEDLIDLGVHILTEKEAPIHVSGHPSRGDLKKMYAWIRPEILVPVHGEPHHLREQARYGKACGIQQAIVPENGHVIALSPDALGTVAQVPHGRLALDGYEIVPATGDMIRERQRLSSQGVISISLGYKKQRIESTSIAFVGVSGQETKKMVHNYLSKELDQIVNTLQNKKTTQDEVENAVISGIKSSMGRMKGKKPHIMVHHISF